VRIMGNARRLVGRDQGLMGGHPERRISLAEAGGRCVALTSGRDREALAEHLIARPSQGRPPVVAALTSGFTGACSSAAHSAYEIEMRGVWCGVG
jgi:hypothetical protein